MKIGTQAPTASRWTRDDLPRPDAIRFVTDDVALDLVVDHLNAYYPKPQPYDQGGVRGVDSLLYRAERAERERDAAVARAEAAEQLIPAYAMLDVWLALGRDSIHFDDWYDERGYADAWAELTAAVREAAEARTVPAVTRDEIGNALMRVGVSNGVETHTEVSVGTDAVWSLVSGADPAVYVVRESDVEAQAALRNRFGEFVVNGTVLNVTTAEDCREKAQRHLDAAARCEAIARAIEAEAVVDPVEPEGDVIVRDANGHMWWVTDDGWTNGSSRLDHDWSDVPKPIRSVYRVEQEASSDE